MLLTGYRLMGHDNRSDMIDEDIEKILRCGACGLRLDFDYIRKDFKLVRRRVDVSYTYDGYCIVSRRFKEFCEEQGYQHARFISLPTEQDFYALRASETVEVDHERTGITFNTHCGLCGRWREIVKPEPMFLKNISGPLPDEFYTTDIPFGSRDAQSRGIIIGTETHRKMKLQRFRGVCFTEVFAE